MFCSVATILGIIYFNFKYEVYYIKCGSDKTENSQNHKWPKVNDTFFEGIQKVFSSLGHWICVDNMANES